MRRWGWFLLLGLALLVLAPTASAQGGGPSDDEVNAIAKNLYCPVCESVPLDVCPTAACQQWRQQIADKLAAGWSEQQIYDFFVEQYGDRVLATPPARGLNWLIYVLPPLAILAGGALYYRTVVQGREAPVEEPGKSSRPKDDYLQQLEDELEARR